MASEPESKFPFIKSLSDRANQVKDYEVTYRLKWGWTTKGAYSDRYDDLTTRIKFYDPSFNIPRLTKAQFDDPNHVSTSTWLIASKAFADEIWEDLAKALDFPEDILDVREIVKVNTVRSPRA
ncbi:MAG: hypothetical protein E6Q76_06075 [Rhizobium sp.]|nr:MAG: hypothetical protein E6Q76_06075 [Rhizobium sp.]